MINESSFNTSNIVARRPRSKKVPQIVKNEVLPPAEKSVKILKGYLSITEGVKIRQLEVLTGFCNTFIFRIIAVLLKRGDIRKTKATGKSGRLEITIYLTGDK